MKDNYSDLTPEQLRILENFDKLKSEASEEDLERIHAAKFAAEADGEKKSLVSFKNDPGKSKEFLVLINGIDNDEEFNQEQEFTYWEIVIGREAAYKLIKDFKEQIDWDNSYVIPQDGNLDERVRAIKFVKYVLDSGLITDDGFDPLDYYIGDYEDDEEEE